MPTFADFLKDLLEEATQGLPGVVTRPYFGGTGMYRGGAIFALVSREPRLYLRLPDAGRLAAFLEATGPESREAEVARHWALVPESFHDDAEQLTVWVREAHGLAREEPKRPARRKTTRPRKRS